MYGCIHKCVCVCVGVLAYGCSQVDLLALNLLTSIRLVLFCFGLDKTIQTNIDYIVPDERICDYLTTY